MAPGVQLDTLDRQSQKIEQAMLATVPESEMMSSFIGNGSDEADDLETARELATLAEAKMKSVAGLINIKLLRKDGTSKPGRD